MKRLAPFLLLAPFLAAAALTVAAVLLASCATTIDPKCCATFCAPQSPCKQPRDGGPQ